VTDGIDVLPVRAWARLAVRALDEATGPLDRANVFPVPDADTGTNLALTLREGAAALARAVDGGDDREAATAFARGCLLGARGNSGVIVAAWVGALVESWPAGPAEALALAARAARTAVGEPAAGTALSVADDAASAARTSAGGTALAVLVAACGGAREAVLRSPRDLGPRGRGRLDAGAQGLRLVLGALATACGARDPDLVTVVPDPAAVSVADGTLGSGRPTWDGAVEEVPAVPATDRPDELEVMFTLDVPAPEGPAEGAERADGSDVADTMRAALTGAGTSVAVVGGDGAWRGHVHTADPVAALEAAVGVAKGAGGRLRDVQVQDLTQARDGRLGVVAVTSAPGLVVELARAGAVVLAHGRRRTPPGPTALRRALEEARGRVVLLVAPPGTPVPDAEEPVSGNQGPVVVRVETPTDAHTVAALAALATLPAPVSSAADGPTDLAAPLEVAEAVRDVVGGVRGAVLPTEWASAVGVVEALVAATAEAGSEAVGVVLLVHGLRADEELVARVVEHVAARDPRAEVVVLPSGRDDAVVHVGVEPPPRTGPGTPGASGREGAA
jgi:hypothetical protein